MATDTEERTEANPAQHDADAKLSSSASLARREQGAHEKIEGGLTPAEQAKLDQIEAGLRDQVDSSTKLADKENAFNYTKNSAGNVQSIRGKLSGRKWWIISGGGLAGALVAALIASVGPLSLVINLKEVLTGRWDTRAVTSEIRSRHLLANRLGEENTRGCGIVKLACRYTKPSNKLIKRLDREGIKAFDSDGNIIDKQSWVLGKKRPASYQLPNGQKISAADFKRTILTNPSVASAFRRAHNPRWANWADSVAHKLLKRFGIAKRIPPEFDKQHSNKKDLEKLMASLSKTDKLGKNAAKDLIQKNTDIAVKSISKKTAKSGDPLLMAGGLACGALSLPGVVTATIKGITDLQKIRYAFPFLVLADAMKAGRATPEQVSNLASLLTETQNGKSAMDSFGMRNGLLGDVGVAGSNYKKFVPGSGLGITKDLAVITSDKRIRDFCGALTSSDTSLLVSAAKGIKAAMASNPIGWVAIAADAAIWTLDKTGLLDKGIELILGGASKVILDLVGADEILNYFAGNITENLSADDRGNVIASGVNAMFSTAANMGGDAPLTIPQSTAFQQSIAEPVRLAWAQDDRSTLSPLDVSSPYTFLGSLVSGFYPHILRSKSMALGALSGVGNLFSRTITPKTFASSSLINPKEYEMCDDPSIRSNNIASSPFCVPYHGIPAEFVGIDPVEALVELQKMGFIDGEGDVVPGSEMEDFINDCLSGETLSYTGCTIQSRKQALFSLYLKDKFEADAMDTELPAQSSSATSSGATVGSGEWAVSPNHSGEMGEGENSAAWEKWKNDMKGNGKNETGVLKPMTTSFPQVICPSSNSLNAHGGGNLFHPNAAKSGQALLEAYHNDPANKGRYLVPSACFRSIEAQKKAYADMQRGGNLAAPPGRSNHGWGTAIDFRTSSSPTGFETSITSFSSPDYLWLKNNAYKYGWINPKKMQPGQCSGNGCEAWHFQYVGPL